MELIGALGDVRRVTFLAFRATLGGMRVRQGVTETEILCVALALFVLLQAFKKSYGPFKSINDGKLG